MAVGDEQRLITPISQRQFELDALSLERGPNFDPAQIFGSYQAGHGSASGCILLDPERGTFAAQALAVGKELGWDAAKVNVNGGAIALGHPIGASGCRVLVSLLHEMIRRDAKKGLATLCIGGGQGVALAIER